MAGKIVIEDCTELETRVNVIKKKSNTEMNTNGVVLKSDVAPIRTMIFYPIPRDTTIA